jgi:RNA polymerase sigma-70 factor (ECF subfamily)
MDKIEASQQEVFQAYRPLLFSMAYRMLGSVMEAEDCVQEAFLQWHEALASRPAPAIENPKAYLCTLVTRRCIDRLRSARAQREAYVGLWLPEPLVTTDPAELSELSESLSMAFLLLLERLSPLERAVFILRQVFDYDYAEIAECVGKSEEYCRQVMHRARRHLTFPRPRSRMSQEEQQEIFTQFLRACQDGDIDGLMRVLSKEIVLHTDSGGRVSAARNPIVGAERVARYLLGIQRKFLGLAEVTIRPMPINGQPGFVGYLTSDEIMHNLLASFFLQRREGSEKGGARETTKQKLEFYQRTIKMGEPLFALTLTLDEKQIREIDIVVNPDKLRHLPALPFAGEKADLL